MRGKELEPRTKAMFELAARTALDNERLLLSAVGGIKITFEDQLAYYQTAVDAVLDGLDPFDEDFWKQVKEWQKEHEQDNNVNAALLDLKSEMTA